MGTPMNQTVNTEKSFLHTLETAIKTRSLILLVEDEADNLAILSNYLNNAGYTVHTATDGAEAWAQLQTKTPYDLIITDRIMPTMDGMELVAQLKRDATLNRIPVIMQTGAILPEEIVQGVKAGVYYYLTKPYQENALLGIVRSALTSATQSTAFSTQLHQHIDVLDHFNQGSFRLRNLNEAQDIAFLLGSIFPRPEAAVTGLYELLLNAIEHGMLGIGYETKNALLATNEWENEIARRLSKNENRNKSVHVDFKQTPEQLEVTITDPGTGFDWRPFLQIEPARATQANGRGIAKVNLLSFDTMTYTGNGNQVQVVTKKA
jgi:CheY-like chemotaxis protein